MTPSALAHLAALGSVFWAVLLGSASYLLGRPAVGVAAAALAATAALWEVAALLATGMGVTDGAEP